MIIDNCENRILILDFGSQYTQLIARRIRELGVYCEIHRWNLSEEQICKFNPRGIILSGGPDSTTTLNSPRISNYIFISDIPVLGICYGMHVMTVQLGGQVKSSNNREFGYAQVEIIKKTTLISDIYDDRIIHSVTKKELLDVWMSHGDSVTMLPLNFITIGITKDCPFAIIANIQKNLYGLQFHPEVTHTPHGIIIIKRFIINICKCKPLWIPEKIIESILHNITNKIENNKVILGISGGVDSSVTAMLMHRAIGNHLTCIFIDNGLLRFNEAQQVIDKLSNFGLNIINVSAKTRFLNSLVGIYDPEKKRKIIGHLFIEIFEEEAVKLTNTKWLAQGTIYPDIIESGGLNIGNTYVIKSHHNVGGIPKNMNLNLIEPLNKLFKDEVRKIGLKLGLPYDMVYRHPFPGPGLAVRILGEVKEEYCNLLRRADAIFIEELCKANLYHKISQAFAVFLPIRSVSIIGDCRHYDWVISLRAIETIDFMTANWVSLPYSLLKLISNRIINEVHGISRVVYDISNKPPATIEWE